MANHISYRALKGGETDVIGQIPVQSRILWWNFFIWSGPHGPLIGHREITFGDRFCRFLVTWRLPAPAQDMKPRVEGWAQPQSSEVSTLDILSVKLVHYLGLSKTRRNLVKIKIESFILRRRPEAKHHHDPVFGTSDRILILRSFGSFSKKHFSKTNCNFR